MGVDGDASTRGSADEVDASGGDGAIGLGGASDGAPRVARARLSRGLALRRALVGWVVLCSGLGLAVGVGESVSAHLDLPPPVGALLMALVMSGIVAPLIITLRHRIDRGTVGSLGWSRLMSTPLALGLGIGLASGAVCWVPAVALGWVRIDGIDPAAFAAFLLLNGLVLLLYEALPEELAIRGYMWTNLRDGFGPRLATLASTLVFPLSGLVVVPIAAVSAAALGGPAPATAVFPADPVTYVIQLVLFGFGLAAARALPLQGALLAAIAFHWTQLTVNRIVLGGTQWIDSGVSVTLAQPGAVALLLVHLLVAWAAFAAVGRVLRRGRRGSRAP
ncbi:hypothetical protein BFL35_14010 [Clavibacter michiganensis]|nr:hypothetical protein BFL35_14010 [Clavibacter michiganensis]